MFEKIEGFLSDNSLARSVAKGVSIAIIALLVIGALVAIVLTFAHSVLWAVIVIFCAVACGVVAGFFGWVDEL